MLHGRLESVLADRLNRLLVQTVPGSAHNADIRRNAVLVNHQVDQHIARYLGILRFLSELRRHRVDQHGRGHVTPDTSDSAIIPSGEARGDGEELWVRLRTRGDRQMNVLHFAARILAEFGEIDFEICGAPDFDDRRIILLVRGLGKFQRVGNGSLSDPRTGRGEAIHDLRSEVFLHCLDGDGSRFTNQRCGKGSDPAKMCGEIAVGGGACDRVPQRDAGEGGSRIDGIDGEAVGLAIGAPLAVACDRSSKSGGDCLIADLMGPDNGLLACKGHTRKRGHRNPTDILAVQGCRGDHKQKKGAASHTGALSLFMATAGE
jgi:hypothetical protein